MEMHRASGIAIRGRVSTSSLSRPPARLMRGAGVRTCSAAEQAPVKMGLVTSHDQYKEMYDQSIKDPAGFWSDIAEEFHWEKKWDKDHFSYNFNPNEGKVNVEFFKGGLTNICYNALDRHVNAGDGDMPCFVFEGNDVGFDRTLTYAETLEKVCKLANWLKSVGVQKGDVVAIYMPMVLELPIAMLACARIGAVHSVVFGGFSAEALSGRLLDAKNKVLLTCNGAMRGQKKVDLKTVVDKAVALCKLEQHEVENVLVYENTSGPIPAEGTNMVEGRDLWWATSVEPHSSVCPVEWVDSEHPLFLLYTSGSTGKPKGVLHTTGGLMVYSATTCKHVFNLQKGDMYWCTADCGWITGHSYITYGPLLNGATNIVFEGIPTYPSPGRCWEIVEKHKVKQFYTAPTAIRLLMRYGEDVVKHHDRSSLKVLGSVGEPINPDAWKWYHNVVGEGRCPIVDTWWQTETGGHMITPLPGAWPEKPGSATLPFFGVLPVVLDANGKELEGEAEGTLAIKQPWPSTLRTVYGDHKRYEETYFSPFPGYFFTGDGCRRDADGYFWITGRVDDVINVSGHRIGTAEVEGALGTHPACAEAAVVGYAHDLKGEGIYAYVTLKEGFEYTAELKREMITLTRTCIGAFAAPDFIHWAPTGLPKTRSGKIMRRILRKIATKEEEQLGDISTLADPSVVQTLLDIRQSIFE